MGNKGFDVEGRLAFVTGGSSGIGLCFCRELARRGCSVIMVSNVEDDLRSASEELRKDYDVEVHTLFLDLTADDIICRIDSWLNETGLQPDIVINNAGIFSFCEMDRLSDRKIECYIDLHIRAVTQISLYFAKRLVENGGRILNMSSMSCWMPMPGIAMYSATKAYIRVMSRALHYEMRDTRLRVTVACPGGIATDLFGLPENLKRLAVNIGAITTPEKFVKKAVRVMEKGKMQYVNGILNRLTILFIGVTPTWMRMLVKRRLLNAGIRKM